MRFDPPRGRVGAVITGVSHLGVALRRRLGDSTPLGAPTVSVGNLAFGGRGKTPIAAMLATHALRSGLRPAILTRGYGGRRGPPRVAVGVSGEGPVWARGVRVDGVVRPSREWATELGDEAPWMAARVPGVPVVVHPDRRLGARQAPDADLHLLDDGAQLAHDADARVLCVDPSRDPPWSARPEAQRERPDPLARAHAVVAVDPPEGRVSGGVSHVLRRRRPVFSDLSGRTVAPPDEAIVLAGVGRPEGVVRLVRVSGVSRVRSVDLADHRRPTGRLLRSLAGASAIVVTEKDAIRWAAAWGDPRVRVLSASLEGVEGLWASVRAALPLC